MGILEELLSSLDPETRKELTKELANHAVKSAGDAVYKKADEIRKRIEEARAAEAEKKRREQEAAAKVEQKRRDARQIDDELAALKAQVARDKKKK